MFSACLFLLSWKLYSLVVVVRDLLVHVRMHIHTQTRTHACTLTHTCTYDIPIYACSVRLLWLVCCRSLLNTCPRCSLPLFRQQFGWRECVPASLWDTLAGSLGGSQASYTDVHVRTCTCALHTYVYMYEYVYIHVFVLTLYVIMWSILNIFPMGNIYVVYQSQRAWHYDVTYFASRIQLLIATWTNYICLCTFLYDRFCLCIQSPLLATMIYTTSAHNFVCGCLYMYVLLLSLYSW